MRLLLLAILLATPTISATSTDVPNFLDSFLGAFRGPGGFNLTQAMSIFQMPSCMSTCMPHVDELFKAASRNTSQAIVLSSMCSNFEKTTDCAVNAGCSEIFAKATSHLFEIVCLQNVESFSKSFECLKSSASDLQPECERRCGVQKNILEKASDNKISQLVDVTNICNSTTCLLHCFQDGLNKKCLGSSSLVERFMANFARNGNDVGDGLSWILPEACRANSFSLPQQIPLGLPSSVGKTSGIARLLQNVQRSLDTRAMDDDLEQKLHSLETSLFVDGEVRTLQCSMYDWRRQPVAMPDFETLAMIMTKQLLPGYEAKAASPIHLATEEDFIKAEERVEAMEKANDVAASSEDAPQLKRPATAASVPNDGSPNNPSWRNDEDGLIIPVDGAAASTLILVASVAIYYYI